MRGLLIVGFTTLFLIVAAPAFAQTQPSPSPNPIPTAITLPGPTPSPTPGPDFEEPDGPSWWDLPGRIRQAISQWFADLVGAALRPVFDLLGRTVFATPDYSSNARVVSLWRFSLGIADAAILLFVLVGAGVLMAGTSFSSQMTAKEMLPRLVLAAGAANLSLVILGQLTSVSNALSRTLLGAAVDPVDVSDRMLGMLTIAALRNVFIALLALVVVVLGILVVVAYVVRVALLVVLAAGAPLLLIGHALPQTEQMASTWWRGVLALLAAPVLQSMVLAAALRVFLTSGALGLPAGSGLVDLLIVGCLLYLLYKIPFVALRRAMGSRYRSFSQARAAVRVIAMRGLMR